MKRFKKIICFFLVATTAIAIAACGNVKKRQPQVIPQNLSTPEQRTRAQKQGDVFVSLDGDDKSTGAKEAPVRTVQRALMLARALNKQEKVIYFSNGNYQVSAFILTQADSGITFFAEEDVTFDGGVTLNSSDFEDYKNNIKVLDLQKYGITTEKIGALKAFGQYNTAEKYDAAGSMYCELFYDNHRMTLSRYPNVGADLKTGKILDNGDSKEFYTDKGTQTNEDWADKKFPRGGSFGAEKTLTDRISGWTTSPAVWMFGYFQYDWADSTTPLKAVTKDSITTEYASVYGFKEGTPYYFFNVFEELDAENEWYIDQENLKLYFIPPADFSDKKLQLSLETKDLVTVDGANNITFDGITFQGTRANAINGNGDSLIIQNCTIQNIGKSAIELEGVHITVENNTITSTGKAGIVLTGGDRQTLTASENRVTNNLIYDWSQIYQTYQAAVALHGVGGVCSNNEIYNSPHEAITYTGNNHVIEYNLIHDVVLKSSDAGAIYAGRSWSNYGTVIRYNCIYNIGSGEFAPSGIYFDDALSGQKAYGNLLVNIPSYGFLLGGGRDLEVTNNILVNTSVPILYDERAIGGIEDSGWFNHAKTPGAGLWATLSEVDVQAPAWRAAFPELTELTSDFDNTDVSSFAANPADSKVQHNVIVGAKKEIGDISKRAKKFSDISQNQLYKFSDNPFLLKGNYQLAEPPEGFKQLPLEKMGRLYVTK